ncbi:hypothetical protein JHK82_043826 [Glycine max]|nr:hypothetical protein JHK86_043708 [Glycine max]KAG4957995.1 hypothetical protein JHK85_044375 [Glycine max]KAG5106856.1 hypothetical protein JHK82_043826 [Glycine max]KAG5117780.1 hypothetical protein JHK84_043893 [Glycine max]
MSVNSSTRGNATLNRLCYYRRRATIRTTRTTRNNGRLFYVCSLPQIEHGYFVLCSKIQINVISFRGLIKTLMLMQLK